MLTFSRSSASVSFEEDINMNLAKLADKAGSPLNVT